MGIRKKRKIFAFVMVLMGVALLFLGVSPSNSFAGKKGPIKIGLLSPFSPPGDAGAGKRMKWGAELAIKYINEEMGGVICGRPVQLVVGDDAGTPAEGMAAFRKLVQKDHVVAVVGQYHSSVCIALTKMATDLKVPLFSTGASSTKITESESPYIFSIMSLIPDRAKFWIGFAKHMGWKKIAVLSEDTDYGTGLKTWVEKFGKEAGMKVKGVIFPRTLTDLTPMLLKVKSWKPDLLINVGVPPAAYLMVKQSYDIGLFPKVPMLASFAWPIRPEFWDAAGKKGVGILYNAYYKPGMLTTRLGNWMIPKYKALHKEGPTFFALNAFGEILVVAQAIDMAQSDNPQKIAEALVDWPYLNWSGIVSFKEQKGYRWHNVSAPNLILQETAERQSFDNAKLVWPPEFGGDGKIVKP